MSFPFFIYVFSNEASKKLSEEHSVHQQTLVLTKTVRVRNFSDDRIRFEITPTFRSPGPEGSGFPARRAPSADGRRR